MFGLVCGLKYYFRLLMNQPECSESSFLVCFGVFAAAVGFVKNYQNALLHFHLLIFFTVVQIQIKTCLLNQQVREHAPKFYNRTF
jgi:hypothetical protein